MKISEIFKSISGESINAGYPATFIRTFSCNLLCKYCDSLYAVKGDDYKEMSLDDIMDEVNNLGCKRVVYTGGEPLLQKDAKALVTRLVNDGYLVEIETNGSVPIQDYLMEGVTVTMDWKSKSSGMNAKMLSSNLYDMRESDVVKFVVGSKEDLDDMCHVAAETKAMCFVSPIFGDIEPSEIAEYLVKNNLDDIRMQLQIHKLIYDPAARGV